MRFKLDIDLSNDAFQYNQADAIAACLEQVKRKLAMGVFSYGIYDANGNRVGLFDVVEEG